jgi:DNA-binding LacI/PurR family transcriptional regulator
MRDIAHATGVSQSTVSRVLSGAPTTVPIAEQTRQRVLDAAKAVGYRPNPLARGLRGARTMLLGVIVRICRPFFAPSRQHRSKLSRYNNARPRPRERGRYRRLGRPRGPARRILFLGDLRDRAALSKTSEHACRHSCTAAGERHPHCKRHNRAGISDVIDHLAGLGHRRIAFAGRKRLGDIREREEAYLASLGRHGLAQVPAYLQDASNDFEGGAAALDRLMDLEEPPSAIVAPTDVIAIGMLHAAQRRGLRIPSDVSISGFDDIPVAAFSVPALTTVRMPIEAMVRSALDIAIDTLEGRLAIGADVHPLLGPELVVRASTGPPPVRAHEGA